MEPKHQQDEAVKSEHATAADIDLFRGLAIPQIENILAQCPTRDLTTGDALLEPGQPNHYLFLLVSGRLDIRLKSLDSPIADVIEVGDCIGEMSIIDGQPTSAFVIAAEPSRVVAIPDSVFWSKIATGPEAVRNLSRILAERMRKRNEATLRALEKELRLEQLQKELNAAYEIQNGMLPLGPSLLKEFSTLDVYARMDVVKTVGGDFYDALRIDENHVCISIGDVSGKGMPAALFMVRAMTLLRSELARARELGESMTRFNQVLCDTNIYHMFVSLVVLVIDVRDGSAEYVNAGHAPMLIEEASGSYRELDGKRGLVAGVLDDSVYESSKITLQKGAKIVLYTDGVTEARNSERKFFGVTRLLETLNNCKETGAGDCVNDLFNAVTGFSGGMDQSDDITVVIIHY